MTPPHITTSDAHSLCGRVQAETSGAFSTDVVNCLQPLGVMAVDITGDEMGKTHAKHLAGGRPGELKGERTIRFEFPENAGALHEFLASLQSDWYLTMLHYRNHGGQVSQKQARSHAPGDRDQ